MCIICIDYQKHLITAAEARRNLGEIVVSLEHLLEIEDMLDQEESE